MNDIYIQYEERQQKKISEIENLNTILELCKQDNVKTLESTLSDLNVINKKKIMEYVIEDNILDTAIINNKTEQVKVLLKHGGDIYKNEYKCDLYMVISYGNKEMCDIIMNYYNKIEKDTIFMIIGERIYKGINHELVIYEINEDLEIYEINLTFLEKKLLLLMAILYENHNIINVFLHTLNINSNIYVKPWGLERNDVYLLIEVIYYDCKTLESLNSKKEIIKLLIEYGININIRVESIGTPLMICIKRQDHELIELILSFKPDIKINDDKNMNVLEIAIVNGFVKSIKMLLDYCEKNIEIKDEKIKIFNLGLLMASRKENPIIMELLLDYGAEINCIDINHHTPLEISILYNNISGCDFLLNRKAKIFNDSDLKNIYKWSFNIIKSGFYIFANIKSYISYFKSNFY